MTLVSPFAYPSFASSLVNCSFPSVAIVQRRRRHGNKFPEYSDYSLPHFFDLKNTGFHRLLPFLRH